MAASGTTRILRGPTALSQVGPAFDALCTRVDAPVTSRRPWLQAWIDSYGDHDPWVACVERDAELVACAPLALRRRPGGLVQVVGLGHGPTDDLRLPAVDDDAADRLADLVVTSLPRRWALRVEQVDPDDRVVRLLQQRLGRARLEPGEGLPTVRFTGREPQDYLSRNTRKALAKIRNKMAAAGLEPDLAWTSDADAITALLPELQRVHRARDEQLGRRSDHDDPRAAAFFCETILRHAERGEVELLTLRLSGDLAAYLCALSDGRALRSWDNRLAPQWADFSAGRVANTEALVHVATSDRWDELDWMQGEEPYKLQSATAVLPRSNLLAFSSPAVARGHELVERARAAKRGSTALTRAWWILSDLRRGRRPDESEPVR